MSRDLRGRPVWVAAFERTHNDDGEPVNGEHPLVFVPRHQGTGPTVHVRREDIMDRYSNEAARAAGPDIDDECPAWAMERIAALEKLARDQHAALGPHGDPLTYHQWADIDRRARKLLDLDPPGFDPATEGP